MTSIEKAWSEPGRRRRPLEHGRPAQTMQMTYRFMGGIIQSTWIYHSSRHLSLRQPVAMVEGQEARSLTPGGNWRMYVRFEKLYKLYTRARTYHDEYFMTVKEHFRMEFSSPTLLWHVPCAAAPVAAQQHSPSAAVHSLQRQLLYPPADPPTLVLTVLGLRKPYVWRIEGH